MTSNSKSALLEILGKGDAMHGWGAILALGRDKVNQLIEAQFIENFNHQDFIKPITDQYYSDSNYSELVVLDGVMLGPPTLSFEQSSGRTSTVTVAMELIAGRCSAQETSPGNASRLRRSHELAKGMGYTLQMQAKLVVVPVPGSKQQQLAIDFGQATDPVCNLAFAGDAARKMGEFFLKQLRQQPDFKQIFGFINIAPISNDVLTIDRIDPIAQKAPEGAGQGSQPGADGAVLLLMQLRGDANPGVIPDAFTYLLPLKDEPGDGNFSATLLLGKIRATFSTDLGSGLLSQLIMPEGYVVSIREEHDPHDKVLFGDVWPSTSICQLLPPISHLGAGESLTYTTGCDNSLSGWEARDITSPRAAGTIDSGVYSSRPSGELASAQRVVVVSAKVSDQPDAATRSALLVESSEPLIISPRVIVWYSGQDPINFTSNAIGNIEWKPLGEKMGELVKDANDPRRAVFTPAESSDVLVRVQRVEVSVGEARGHATVVMLKAEPKLDVAPYYVPTLRPGTTQTFSLDDPQTRWENYGPGEIDPGTGVYRAPDQPDGEASVVVGYAGRFFGVAVVEHYAGVSAQAFGLAERWKALKEFSLTLNNKNRNKVWANGYQQVGIDIVIATHSFTGGNGEDVWDPVNDTELSTLVLLDEIGNEIPYLTPDQLGIPADSPELWMARKKRNHFDYYPVDGPGAAGEVRGAEEGKRTVTLFVHSKSAEVARFKAKFQDYNRGWRNSVDIDEAKGKVEISGIKTPEPSLNSYLWPNQGGKRVAESQGFTEGDDAFNYWHRTTDYWQLSGNGISFVEVAFESASMIRWESEQIAETFGTYTGIVFKPRRPLEAPPVPIAVQYQAELQLLSKLPEVKVTLDTKLKGQGEPSEGALIITLERVPDLGYWSPTRYRDVLEGAMKFSLIDNYGTTHRLKVLFGSGMGGRNVLELQLQ